jgi:hypothetical protein
MDQDPNIYLQEVSKDAIEEESEQDDIDVVEEKRAKAPRCYCSKPCSFWEETEIRDAYYACGQRKFNSSTRKFQGGCGCYVKESEVKDRPLCLCGNLSANNLFKEGAFYCGSKKCLWDASKKAFIRSKKRLQAKTKSTNKKPRN